MFVFRLKSLNCLLLFFLLLCVQKQINVQKKMKASEPAKPSVVFFIKLPINLNFVRARLEIDITWVNVCVLKP